MNTSDEFIPYEKFEAKLNEQGFKLRKRYTDYKNGHHLEFYATRGYCISEYDATNMCFYCGKEGISVNKCNDCFKDFCVDCGTQLRDIKNGIPYLINLSSVINDECHNYKACRQCAHIYPEIYVDIDIKEPESL